MLYNLLGNALKFTYAGTVGIEVNVADGDLSLTVSDTGVGINQEDLGKLFKFFGKISKTKEMNRGGMGLGLTISKMILHELGGKIDVVSEVNKGSKFTFTIPLRSSDETGLQEPLNQCQHIDFRPSSEDIKEDLSLSVMRVSSALDLQVHFLNKVTGKSKSLEQLNCPNKTRKVLRILAVDPNPCDLITLETLVFEMKGADIYFLTASTADEAVQIVE